MSLLYLARQFLASLGNLSSYQNTPSTAIYSLYIYGLAAKAAVAAAVAVMFHGQLRLEQVRCWGQAGTGGEVRHMRLVGLPMHCCLPPLRAYLRLPCVASPCRRPACCWRRWGRWARRWCLSMAWALPCWQSCSLPSRMPRHVAAWAPPHSRR